MGGLRRNGQRRSLIMVKLSRSRTVSTDIVPLMIIFGTILIAPHLKRLENSTIQRISNSNVSIPLNFANLILIIKETHLTDNEIERIKKANEEEERKKMHIVARQNAIERISVRKAERQVVQFKANQAMNEGEMEQAGIISETDP